MNNHQILDKVKYEFTEKQPTLRILEASVQYKWDNYTLIGLSEQCPLHNSTQKL